MNELEKLNAIIAELEQQRNWALTRCATLAAELTIILKEKKEKESADS